MKKTRRWVALTLVLALVLSLTACSTGGGESSSSQAPTSTTEPSSSADSDTEVSSETDTTGTGADLTSYPREETLYLGGQQWGTPVSNNPLAANPNYTCVTQNDNSTLYVWETLYMWNPSDETAYPLLADGDYQWNEEETAITVKLKEAAHWSDGTPVTAADVEATWDAHVNYQSNQGVAYSPYIADIVAVDDYTVEIQANTDNLNRMKVLEYLPRVFVMQKAYLDSLAEANGGDATAMKNEPMWDAPHTGPYSPREQNDQKWVIERDDNYWGQDESMWGKLPVPKYVIHNIYSSNDVSAQAFANGEIDVNQSYVANIEKMWEDQGLPVSTYISEPPYNAPGQIPSVIFNTQRNGLDQVAVRKAIAMATDYDQIVNSAMTGQAPSFSEYPRTIFNWSEAQQSLILDPEALAPLQWEGNDIEGANALLDEAGIVDTNGDGNREYNGQELSYQVECPTGFSDWEATLQIVQEAGKAIGIQIETYFPETAQYTDDIQAGNFDITMSSTAGGISAPWTVFYFFMYGFGGEFPEAMTTNYGRYYNPEADELLDELSNTTEEDRQLEIYQRLNEIYLTDVPSFGAMYRPTMFMSYFEETWTNFPNEHDGTDPKVPPLMCSGGYGIAALYNLELVDG